MVQLDIILAAIGLLSCANTMFYYIFVAIRAKWNQHCHRSACKPIFWSLLGVSLVLAVGTATALWVLCFPFWHPVSGFICVAKFNLLLKQSRGAAPQNGMTQLGCGHSSISPMGTAASCATALAMPKVALLFLARDALPHQELWKAWLGSAAALVNTQCLRGLPCQNFGSHSWQHLQELCGSSNQSSSRSVLEQQHMFSVYVHNWPNSTAFDPDSVFHNQEVSQRVETQWGHHSLAEASRRLLQAALQDPLNQRFVLVSEDSIPLYPPATIYQQLMLEDKSRINACKLMFWRRQMNRYQKHPGFREEGITPDMWRKHWQWFALVRKHAQVVADDKTVINVFAKHCYTFQEGNKERECFSDEHYISTLLAVHGLDHETDCLGVNMHADWAHKNGSHPRSYMPEQITPGLINSLRLPLHGCNYDAAIDSSNHVFKHIDTIAERDCIGEPQPPVQSLGYQCPLFARKFPLDTVSTALDLFLEQESHGVQLLNQW
ncbi:hypothetical protein ABBQ38_000452 [Trebouxia sp. C0009 RCD-2024]